MQTPIEQQVEQQNQAAEEYFIKYPILKAATEVAEIAKEFDRSHPLQARDTVKAGQLLDFLGYIPLGQSDWSERISFVSLLQVLSDHFFCLEELQEGDRWLPEWKEKRIKKFTSTALGIEYWVLDLSGKRDRWVRSFTIRFEKSFFFPITVTVSKYVYESARSSVCPPNPEFQLSLELTGKNWLFNNKTDVPPGKWNSLKVKGWVKNQLSAK